ncbi:MAG TPA: hypothetical protein EYN73_09635 [Chromatiaceae bacterium]|jgi:hypothetical protein|nr:hypothetical protein [Chromatiaceae bacterium]HIB84077.1 hypothetical protein [Chromatiaceae bacterium]HIO03881.1 hypothetical protein [Alphaproteobacteria bacterium]
MKCFVPLPDEVMLDLWIKDPTKVIPFSKPIVDKAYFGSEQTKACRDKVSMVTPSREELDDEDD